MKEDNKLAIFTIASPTLGISPNIEEGKLPTCIVLGEGIGIYEHNQFQCYKTT